ncbi:MAG: hypothetical protein LBD82_08115, partial [Deltaproteobacteria bacterium]|nr:hypothetical protein [Deltaproteobacteria bacterium]
MQLVRKVAGGQNGLARREPNRLAGNVHKGYEHGRVRKILRRGRSPLQTGGYAGHGYSLRPYFARALRRCPQARVLDRPRRHAPRAAGAHAYDRALACFQGYFLQGL